MKHVVLNRFSGEPQFTAEIDCKEDALPSVKLGLAVKWAIKTKTNLRYADLRYADLRYADLRSANLSSANLRSANLSSANLRSFKADYWMVLTGAQAEVPGLIAALREGRVDGSTYEGECACLVGTIANVRHVDVNDLERDSSRPAEQWFMMIRNGDKPGDDTGGGFASGKAIEWALEYAALTGIPIDAPAVTEITPAA